MLSEASRKPFFGEGVGTRLTGSNTPNRNAPILDNQWLDNVLDVGFIGLGAWIWLFVRAIRIFARASRAVSHVDDDWLFAALAASVTGFGVGMLTFDAFGYTQVTLILWVFIALGAALLRISGSHQTAQDAAAIDGRLRLPGTSGRSRHSSADGRRLLWP
jgi:O-antigen ligase